MNLVGDISQAHRIREQLLNRQSGKWLLTQSNPDEFDYYMIALELLKSDFSTSKYFVFPILPNSIEYNDTPLTKVSKTAGGVSVLKSQQFNIKNLNISGSFGKNFKVLLGDDFSNLTSAFNSNSEDKFSKSLNNFSSAIKTGYGCTKVMESILKTSNQKDEFGGAHFLIFYNLAFNQKFLVEFNEQSYSQNLESNGIWNYSVRFNAIGEVDDFINADNIKTTKQLATDNMLQKNANKVYSKVSNVLRKKYDNIF